MADDFIRETRDLTIRVLGEDPLSGDAARARSALSFAWALLSLAARS
jgi:hypothetical protein